jgi:hypothetical protein
MERVEQKRFVPKRAETGVLRVAVTRKEHNCCQCGTAIRAGSRVFRVICESGSRNVFSSRYYSNLTLDS